LKTNSRSLIILGVVFGYIILQFLWWEILLVRQTSQIIDGKQQLTELTSTSEQKLISDITSLHQKKKTKIFMIVGEGTVFLLLLLFGIYKIRQAHSKESALNNSQKNFFLSITHELKTPIAATKLQLQTLQKHNLSSGQQSTLLQNALDETNRLNILIDNVLLATRLDSGLFIIKKENINLSELTENITQRYYKNEMVLHQINLDIEHNIFLKADESVFPSIIINLIDNAIKYSLERINIVISFNKITLSVSDNGCGISTKDKKNIFIKFYRVGSEETRVSKGTGLGLYIVNYIVEKHGGQIFVQNNSPQGSTFVTVFNA
jgi:K+-sensing histidine kinase KdpD